MSANVKSILANANLTEAEGKMVLDNLGVAAELLPFFKDKLSSQTPTAQPLETDAQQTDQTVSGEFMQYSRMKLVLTNIQMRFRSLQVPSRFE